LVSYESGTELRAGIVLGGLVVDGQAAAVAAGLNSQNHWTAVRTILGAGADQQRALLAGAEVIASAGDGALPLDGLVLGPPVPDPDKIICLGLNYRDHAAESGLPLPTAPMLFAKFRNSLVGATAAVELPAVSDKVDYEAELAVVIGRRARAVPAARALESVAGVMAFNDLTARDLQHQTSQWTAGKAVDGFAPCGPALVSLDELADLQALRLTARVNGQLVQDGTTADMIFPIAETIAFISRTMTLEPGDIIATGTPAGVGVSRDPPLLLGDGDVVEVELEGVGTLRNRMVVRAPAAAR
jgi:2-keto-4-pentenoate hydratase/2-oxohepta-3-ene-1,7-dioic acid hydratase in catechol pathway